MMLLKNKKISYKAVWVLRAALAGITALLSFAAGAAAALLSAAVLAVLPILLAAFTVIWKYYIPALVGSFVYDVTLGAVHIKYGLIFKREICVNLEAAPAVDELTPPVTGALGLTHLRLRLSSGSVTIPFLERAAADDMIRALEDNARQ